MEIMKRMCNMRMRECCSCLGKRHIVSSGCQQMMVMTTKESVIYIIGINKVKKKFKQTNKWRL